MGETRDDSREELRRHWLALTELGQALPGTGLAATVAELKAGGQWPEDLRHCPMIIDTDIGGDADDALAVAAAARTEPNLSLVITADETGHTQGLGQRARFARLLLDALNREDVATVAGKSLGDTRYFCVEDLIPAEVPQQPTDVVAAVRTVCDTTVGPVRWVGMGPLGNLASVLQEAPDLATRLRVTQMGGALNYRDPEAAEHNIRLDVPAARTVLAAVSAGRLTAPEFVASDVTFTPQTELTADSPLYAVLRSPAAPFWATLLADHLDRWFERFYPHTMQHDALTLSAALDLPFVESEPQTIKMDEIGRTTVAVGGEGARLWWSFSADYEPFMRWLTDVLDPTANIAAARS